MLQVQAFELRLAGPLTAWAPGRPSAKNARRALERSGQRIMRLLEKGTASKMRDELSGKIDPGVLEEVNFLLPWRNLLAHHYLRQRLPGLGEKELRITPDMPFELAARSSACSTDLASVSMPMATKRSNDSRRQSSPTRSTMRVNHRGSARAPGPGTRARRDLGRS